MKIIDYIFCFFVFIGISSNKLLAQQILVKDIDFDGIKDSIFYKSALHNERSSGFVQVKLSTQKFQTIVSTQIDIGTCMPTLSEIKKGFEIVQQCNRSVTNIIYQYSKKYKKIRLIRLQYVDFGNASQDGSGRAVFNLVNQTFIAQWNSLSFEEERVLKLPLYQSGFNILPTFLSDTIQTVLQKFESKCDASKDWSQEQYTKNKKTTENIYDQLFTGRIGEDTSYFIRFHIYDSIQNPKGERLVVGSTNYPDSFPLRPVIGTINKGGNFLLKTFDDSGKVVALFMFKREKDSLLGEVMQAPFSKNQKAVHFYFDNSSDNLRSRIINSGVIQISGKYVFSIGQKGPQGTFSLKKIGENKLQIEASGLSSAPSRNMATLKKDTITLNGHQFTYKLEDGEDCKIVMKVRLYNQFIWVYYINKNPCNYYFGYNASLEGIYYKENSIDFWH